MAYPSGNWSDPVAASHLSPHQLWMEFITIGGDTRRVDFDDIIDGRRIATMTEHNVLAQVLNERLHDLGHNWPVPYQD